MITSGQDRGGVDILAVSVSLKFILGDSGGEVKLFLHLKQGAIMGLVGRAACGIREKSRAGTLKASASGDVEGRNWVLLRYP